MIIALTIHNGGYYPFDKKCVWILIYEMIGVYLVIGLFAKKIPEPEKSRFQNSDCIGVPNSILAVSLLPICVIFPTLLTRFSVDSSVSKAASAIGVVEVVFSMGIWVAFVFLITRVANEKKYRTLCLIWAIAIAAYYVMFNSISGEDVKRWQIISCGMAMLYICINLFPERRNHIISFGIVGIIVSVVLGSLIKFGNEGSIINIAGQYFDVFHFTEYFGGMKNITTAMDLFSNNEKLQGTRSLFTDLFSGMPVVSSFFDYNTYSSVAMFEAHVMRTDVICPLTAQSIAHFGVLGAPIFGMAMAYMAIMFNKMLNETRSYYSAYVLIELVVWFSLFMALNTTIILGKMWIRLMFLLLQQIDRRTLLKFKWGRVR